MASSCAPNAHSGDLRRAASALSPESRGLFAKMKFTSDVSRIMPSFFFFSSSFGMWFLDFNHMPPRFRRYCRRLAGDNGGARSDSNHVSHEIGFLRLSEFRLSGLRAMRRASVLAARRGESRASSLCGQPAKCTSHSLRCNFRTSGIFRLPSPASPYCVKPPFSSGLRRVSPSFSSPSFSFS